MERKKQYDIDVRDTVPTEKISTELWISNMPTPYMEDRQFFKFKKDVTWVLETEATVKCFHNNIELYKGDTYSDFYGMLQCLKSIEEESYNNVIKNLAIDENSTLEVTIELKARLIPALTDRREKAWHDMETYKTVPDCEWLFYEKDNSEEFFNMSVEERISGKIKQEYIKPITIFKEKIKSSFNETEINKEDLSTKLIELMEIELNKLYPTRKLKNNLKNI